MTAELQLNLANREFPQRYLYNNSVISHGPRMSYNRLCVISHSRKNIKFKNSYTDNIPKIYTAVAISFHNSHPSLPEALECEVRFEESNVEK